MKKQSTRPAYLVQALRAIDVSFVMDITELKLIFGLILCLLESMLHNHWYTIITHGFLCES